MMIYIIITCNNDYIVDSETLLTDNTLSAPPTPYRAASELDLRRSDSNDSATETSSLKDEPYINQVYFTTSLLSVLILLLI